MDDGEQQVAEAETEQDGAQDDEQEVPTDEDGNQLAPDGSTVEEVEADREERLAPENRPDGAEIDNTQRTFNEETGMFEDSEGADEAEPVYKTASEES
ncbi:hypothetical protein [Nocardioides sp. CFH 31398]|uniref:hypothetical protein n=1 Tax=Nocardioides sp. CFH 31398 TaxID=2919579 RepID=UPI001F054B23|nr:hypothetical protein [Nocardioides sp. CFH 31398]MCH1865246.1 hypothetical protein [Nocardioides sp. CFH 31398]